MVKLLKFSLVSLLCRYEDVALPYLLMSTASSSHRYAIKNLVKSISNTPSLGFGEIRRHLSAFKNFLVLVLIHFESNLLCFCMLQVIFLILLRRGGELNRYFIDVYIHSSYLSI